MTDIIVYGVPGSPFLRAVLLGLHEKDLNDPMPSDRSP